VITVIDYGMGNLRSVVKAIEKFTDQVRVSSDPKSIESSKALVMPGDGAFGPAMDNLERGGWLKPLKEYIAGDNFFLGICLGFQLLFSKSEEFGVSKGLDLIPGQVVRFQGAGLKVPHLGWNKIKIVGNSKFLKGIPSDSYFYFIHSYYPVVEDKSWEVAQTSYGPDFTCMVGKNNLLATQFHPEKSHNLGLKIIENFVEAVC